MGLTGFPHGQVVLGSTGMVDLPPVRGGGVEAYVWDVARILGANGHRVTVVSNSRPGLEVPGGVELRASGSFVDRFPLRPFPSAVAHTFGGVFTARAIRRLLCERPTDEVVLHLNEEVSSTLLSSRFPRLPKVFTIHNPPPIGDSVSYGLLERTVRWVNSSAGRRLIWSRMDVVIALSGWIRGYLLANGLPDERVALLPVPIDTDHYRPTGVDPSDHSPYFLYVGRLDARKNVLELVRAMADTTNGSRLVLVGRGPATGQVRELVRRLDLEGYVTHLPDVGTSQLLGLYQGATAFCLPSTLEAYPRVVLEAAACGVPAILPESFLYSDFRAQGFVESYAPSGRTGLAEAIDRLADDASRRRSLGRAAREYAVGAAGYGAYARRLESVYAQASAVRAAR